MIPEKERQDEAKEMFHKALQCLEQNLENVKQVDEKKEVEEIIAEVKERVLYFLLILYDKSLCLLTRITNRSRSSSCPVKSIVLLRSHPSSLPKLRVADLPSLR